METLALILATKAAKLLVWFLIFLWGLSLFRTVKKLIDGNNKQEEPQAQLDVIMLVKWRLFVFVVMVLLLLYVSAVATAYQPKTSVDQTNHALQQRLNAADQAKIVIPKARFEDNSNWEDEKAKNRRDNKASKEAFSKLPAASN